MKSIFIAFIDKIKSVFLRLQEQSNRYVDRIANKQFYDYPYGKKPHATKEKYLEIWNEAKSTSFPAVDKLESHYGYAVSKDWIDDLALLTQVVIKGSKINYQHGRILYSALCSYIKKNPNSTFTIVETGTARGFSSICMAKALSDMDSYGTISSFDIIPNNQNMFWGCIADLNGPRTRAELLKDYNDLLNKIIFFQGDTKIQVKKFSTSRVNFAFLDGGHEYEDVLNDFHLIYGRQKKGDVVIFDDYTPSKFPGIVRAVDEICLKYKYDTQIILLGTERGYCIGAKK
jgi:hypothetical protein